MSEQFVSIPVSEFEALVDIARKARLLYERVEMDESVGICLSERVPSLLLGAALLAGPVSTLGEP